MGYVKYIGVWDWLVVSIEAEKYRYAYETLGYVLVVR